MTRLIWDDGTAYDFFLSLYVLYHPEEYGLRRAWAAGVRSRLPAEARDLLGDALEFFFAPLHWVCRLPSPRDAATLLDAFAALPAAQRLETLSLSPSMAGAETDLLRDVAARGAWGRDDYRRLREQVAEHDRKPPGKRVLSRYLDMWADAAATGEQLLDAVVAYQEEFFAEEEARIRPVLLDAVDHASALAGELDLPELLDQLARGVRFTDAPDVPELIMAPSFWITPLIVLARLSDERHLFVFGARPLDMSLIPGEAVPDGLYHALKALADPTRLRILRYLTREPLTPADLARRLRLRPPTVTHHLQTLRIAGLIRLTIDASGRRHYAVRSEAIAANYAALRHFLDEASPTADGGASDDTAPQTLVEVSPGG